MDIKHVYSYTAVFEDGTVVEHDRNDVEGDLPLIAEKGNRFSDVMKKSEESKLISFVLHNDEQSVGVDLRDGHFELNGIPFFQHRPDLDGYKDFRVIYYRTVRRVMSQESGEELSGEALAYTIGWQVTHNGNNIQRIVVI